MKKALMSILIIILLMVILCTCTGCYSCNGLFTDDNDDDKNDYRLYTDYFEYYILFNEEVIITNNIGKAFDADYLVIPDEIDGIPVTDINSLNSCLYTSNKGYHSFIKKLYVSKNVAYFDIYDSIDYSKGIKVIFLGATPPKKMNLHECHYISEYVLSNYSERYPNINIANISYLYNYENAPNQNVYFVDILEVNEAFSYIPNAPTREGYIFKGWFSDELCTNEVNLDEFVYMEEYQSVTFYANWQKIEQEDQANEQ